MSNQWQLSEQNNFSHSKNSTIISDKDTRDIYYSTITSIFDISFEHEMIPTKKGKIFLQLRHIKCPTLQDLIKNY